MIAVLAGAVLLMWWRVPHYEDWHWNYDLVPRKTTPTPKAYLDNGREPPDIPTPFRSIDYPSGPAMYNGAYGEGFALAVEEFVTYGSDWALEGSMIAPLASDAWSEEHFDLAFQVGYANAQRDIKQLLDGRSEPTLKRQLDRYRSYYRKLVYPICVTLLLAIAIFVRLFKVFKSKRRRGNITTA